MSASPKPAKRRSDTDDERDQDQVLYRFLVDSLTEYAVFAVSPNGIVISWNAGAQKIFGYTQAEIVGNSFAIIFTTEDVNAGAPQNELSSARSGAQIQHDRWHVRKDGTRFWGTNTVQPLLDATGELLGFTKLVRDATASHAALEKLSDSEQELRLLIESVSDYAIFSTARDGTIRSWSAGAQSLFGYSQADIIGRNFAQLFSSDDVAAGVPTAELRRATLRGTTNVERWMQRADGSRFLASGKLCELRRDVAGELRGFVGIAHDITADDAASQELRRRAQYDELTELANRRTFHEHVQRAIALMKRRPAHLFAVLFIDLDHFKGVNDEFGHHIADGLLTVTARRLEGCVRSEDIVARIGGDEFAILLNGINGINDATDAADRIGLEMREPATIDGRNVRATVSIGISLGSRKYKKPEQILRDADTAMYAAKTEGRARAVTFSPALIIDGEPLFDLAADLRHAIEHAEMRVAYQPIVELRTRRITGFEALVRWEHPRRGLLAPTHFIPRAEQSDLIITIDRWVIREATRQLATWQARGIGGDLQISVNISSKELSRDDFITELRAALAGCGLAPTSLRLEITESAMIERSEQVRECVRAIRAMGIELHLDDFGTGFSSLGWLQHITVDALKIDASFVGTIDSPTGRELVKSVITLAHRLQLSAIAEGIENTEQLDRLIEFGCDFGQGELFSAPLPAADAGRLAAAGVCASYRDPTAAGPSERHVRRECDQRGSGSC
jgi:diguanylate cyclase (GGDEF)-like protein/PAS domain S-box-containing protein